MLLYHCARCGQLKAGYWVRKPRIRNWGRGLNIQSIWVCTECSEQTGEEIVTNHIGAEVLPMVKKSITPTITPPFPATSVSEAQREAQQALALVPSYQGKVEALTVQSDEDYTKADALLGQVNDLRRGWATVWKRIQDKTIKPIRSGLDELYALDRAVDRPLEALASGLRSKMTEFQRERLRIQQDMERREREERERLERAAEEVKRKAERAATPQMRGRLEAQAERITEQAQTVTQNYEAPQLANGRSSSPRREKTVEIELALFLVGIIEGIIPPELITIDRQAILRRWKQEPGEVNCWPGVKIVDDINVVSR